MPATLADIQQKYGESVYPLYKDQMHEPYMESESGIGYQGVVMYNEHEDKIQCSECGKWFQILNSHLHKHKTSASEYRNKFELYKSTQLCSPGYSRKRREETINNKNAQKTQFQKGHGGKLLSKIQEKANKSMKTTRNYAVHKNKYGLCDAQIAARMVVVGKMAHKPIKKITSTDIEKYDRKLLTGICHRYGNYKLAADALGMFSPGRNHAWDTRQKYNDATIIGQLRSYVIINKKIPNTEDLTSINKLPSTVSIKKYFGSWRRAKMMAGLDQLLAEIKP